MDPRPDMPAPGADPGVAELLELRRVGDCARYARGALRRHPILAGGVLLVFFGLSLAVARLLPRTYHAQTRILAQRDMLMASLANPSRSVPFDADAPTRTAYETLRSHDNLLAIIATTHLLERWASTRPPLLKAKDALLRRLSGPVSEADQQEALLGMLTDRLSVSSASDGTITIAIDWPDPALAQELVEAALRNFLEARHTAEVSTIREALGLLQARAAEEQRGIQQALAEVERQARRRQRREEKRLSASGGGARPLDRQQREQLRFLIVSRRRSAAELDALRQRRLQELQAQLTEQRSVYSPTHPQIVDLQERVEALQRKSPQLTALEAETDELVKRYVRQGGREEDLDGAATPDTGEGALARLGAEAADDPRMAVAVEGLQMRMGTYQELVRRIDAARLELETAESSFKRHYSVITPAAFPRQPVKPNPKLLVIAGLLASLALAAFAAIARDLVSGRVLEPWQVNRSLGLPLLADLRARRAGLEETWDGR